MPRALGREEENEKKQNVRVKTMSPHRGVTLIKQAFNIVQRTNNNEGERELGRTGR